MKPLAIRARNFRTWAELELELPSGIAAIVGANGAGKSSIVEAVDLALFGTGRELSRATTRGFDESELELTFEHAGEIYRVRRGRRKGKPALDFERATSEGDVENMLADGPPPAFPYWNPLTRETISATQNEIEELLGLSRITFRASSYLAQGDGAAFTMAEPRDRKLILLDALGVRLWDRLHELAGGYRRHEEANLAGARGKLEHLESILEERSGREAELRAAEVYRGELSTLLDGVEHELETLRGAIATNAATNAEKRLRRERLEVAREARSRVAQRAEKLRLLAADGELTPEAETELRAKVAREPTAERALGLERELEGLNIELTAIERQELMYGERERIEGEHLDTIAERTAGVQAELANLVECPTCGTDLRDEALAFDKASEALRSRLATLEDELGETVERARQAREEAARLAAERVPKDERVRELLGEKLVLTEQIGPAPTTVLLEAKTAERQLAALEERSRHAAARREELAEVEAELVRVNAEVDEAGRAFDELANVKGDEDLRREEELTARRAAKARQDLREADERVARARERAEALARVDVEAAGVRRLIETSERELETLRLAERAFGRDGIPALILETSAIPHLEAEANRIVAELGREYRFELRTQRETGAGTTKEVLDIVVHTGTGEALYEDFSGGERARLDLALRIALARLLAARRGSDVRLLAIDEPAFLDDEGFAALAGVLRDLEGEFETILVVSHVEALRDAFDSAIVVAGGADTGQPSRLEEATA